MVYRFTVLKHGGSFDGYVSHNQRVNEIDGIPNFEIVIFHSYVSLPEGKSQFLNHHFFSPFPMTSSRSSHVITFRHRPLPAA